MDQMITPDLWYWLKPAPKRAEVLQHMPKAWWPPTWRPTTVVGMGSSTDLLSLVIATLAVVLSQITVTVA
jgi:hypothetical protein